MRADMCDFLVEHWQTNAAVYWAMKRLEIAWDARNSEVDLPNPTLYVDTKREPALHAGQMWKWAGNGEVLLCAMMLNRPIIVVGPTSLTNPSLRATIFLPTDTPDNVCFIYHILIFH